ncbi:hypothetical protein RRG08_047716 [Elysia crispata]|uniref:Uncharacterized protein n=1 Tax=Elysia crispata TaxID=231223 RepID=A0AAE1A9R6_9GAST|nr:hypothetical protein RRG08_047716 [Elysia crispata]
MAGQAHEPPLACWSCRGHRGQCLEGGATGGVWLFIAFAIPVVKIPTGCLDMRVGASEGWNAGEIYLEFTKQNIEIMSDK